MEGSKSFQSLRGHRVLLYLLLDCKVKNVEDRAAFTSYEVLAGGVRVGGIDALEARRNIVSVLVSLLRLVSLIPPARNNFLYFFFATLVRICVNSGRACYFLTITLKYAKSSYKFGSQSAISSKRLFIL